MADLSVYRSLESVLDLLRSEEHNNLTEIKELLSIYNSTCLSNSDAVNGTKKHPIIVFEGLDGSGKSTIMKILSGKIKGKKCCTPPESIHSIRESFNKHVPHLRLAYYYLGNYMAANEMKNIRTQQPVLVDRFWHSTTSSALANGVSMESGLPPPDSEVYRWPEDLLKPDIIIFLTVSEEMRIERLSRRKAYTAEEDRLKNDDKFRERLLTAYDRMHEPKVVKVESIVNPKKVAANILNMLTEMGIYEK